MTQAQACRALHSILMFHGGGKKLEDLREIKAEVSLRELLGMETFLPHALLAIG